ncbi:MAG TPA: hypothetical protein P5277_03505 [Candidatus Paceibacterota bacterium]|nr:hypothetical protein [Candidatus Paceibacterota bacterium]
MNNKWSVIGLCLGILTITVIILIFLFAFLMSPIENGFFILVILIFLNIISILGIVFSIIGLRINIKNNEKKKMAIIGLVISVISLIISSWLIFLVYGN